MKLLEIQKILIEKDKKKKGKLNYEDFSAWVGSCIH